MINNVPIGTLCQLFEFLLIANGQRTAYGLPMNEKTKSRRDNWVQNPDAVRADILSVATKVFAERGLAGARIEEIVQKTHTSKRMIYYYFGDKIKLYLSVLEAAYARVRVGEDALELDTLEPVEALESLVTFTFNYHRNNPEYVRLVANENIHGAVHLEKSSRISKLNLPAIEKLRVICKNGIDAGVFRNDLNPVELHWLITSSCLFNVSNRATFEFLYGGELFTEAGQMRLKELVVRTILNSVISNP